MREFLSSDDPSAPQNRHLCAPCAQYQGRVYRLLVQDRKDGHCKVCGRPTATTDDNWSDPTTDSAAMTPTTYLESQGYIIKPVRGIVEVWLGNTLVLSDLTETELAAFAERVKFERKGGEA